MSRRELSRQVCDLLNWRFADGRFKDMSCRKALLALGRRGVLDLPQKKQPDTLAKPRRRPESPEIPAIQCELAQLGEVTVFPVTSRYSKASRDWQGMMATHHYLGGGPLCGAQIRYLVKSSTHGYLGALAFSSAAFALKARDTYIGWSENARRANIGMVVGNSRFLILPMVKVLHLASHVLSLALARLPDDWLARYHMRPVLVETFVDPGRFRGICYKAANWKRIGETAGRRDGQPKTIWVYPLAKNWQIMLCKEPRVGLGEAPRPEVPAHWAEEEFGGVGLHDSRLKERLYRIGQAFYNRPQANIPEACGGKAGAMGAYRFFSNPKVTMDVVLTAHTEAALDRIKQYKVVLAPQDTTTLNYSTHPMTDGLGPINSTSDMLVELLLHDTLAFTEDGTPLGILDAQCWARDPEDRGKRHRRHDVPIEQKESMKWLRSYQKVAQLQALCPDTRLVSIGDRESDIYELFRMAAENPSSPGLLVRAERTRQRKVEQELLWEFMSKREVAGALELHIPHSGSRKARDTWLNIRFAEVALTPPKRYESESPIRVWAVHVLEQEGYQVGGAPVEWMLLTTVAVETFEDARKRVEWYSGRWGIEVYHRVLKSGCRLKDRQLHTADRLEACLGVDMVVAWRIYHMTMLGREVPDVPCTVFFKDVEWKALCCYMYKKRVPPDEPPLLRKAIYMVGAIGGHLGRKGDRPPGTQTLWRGLQCLDTATEMYMIFTQDDNPHPHQSGP